MRIEPIPHRLIKKDSINDWRTYSEGLNGFPYVRKYLESTLKKWVEEVNNPLALRWINSLLEGKLRVSEERFAMLERDLGETNLYGIIKELEKDNSKTSDKISIRIMSLWGEIQVYRHLADRYSCIEKISEVGDWLCNDSVVVSVKTILDLNLHYILIEDNIWSLSFLEENDVIRRYNDTKLIKSENLDDTFRNKVIWFIENLLADSMVFYDKLIDNLDFVQDTLLKNYFHGTTRSSILEIKSITHINRGAKKIEFRFHEKRFGEKEHKIELHFGESQKNTKAKAVSFLTETNFWWEGCEIGNEFLKQRIADCIVKFNVSNRKATEENMEFVGWINLSLHPRYESYLIKNKAALKGVLQSITGKVDYKLVFCVIPSPGFEQKEPILYEIP